MDMFQSGWGSGGGPFARVQRRHIVRHVQLDDRTYLHGLRFFRDMYVLTMMRVMVRKWWLPSCLKSMIGRRIAFWRWRCRRSMGWHQDRDRANLPCRAIQASCLVLLAQTSDHWRNRLWSRINVFRV